MSASEVIEAAFQELPQLACKSIGEQANHTTPFKTTAYRT